MALNLYRRHRRDCKAGHPEESRSGEFDERKKWLEALQLPHICGRDASGKVPQADYRPVGMDAGKSCCR